MEALARLLELDEKHNEILEKLADLDARIAQTLNEWGGGKEEPSTQRVPQSS